MLYQCLSARARLGLRLGTSETRKNKILESTGLIVTLASQLAPYFMIRKIKVSKYIMESWILKIGSRKLWARSFTVCTQTLWLNLNVVYQRNTCSKYPSVLAAALANSYSSGISCLPWSGKWNIFYDVIHNSVINIEPTFYDNTANNVRMIWKQTYILK